MLSKGACDAALRLRRYFMRTKYVPLDVSEFATNVLLELNASIRILNFTRSDSDITKETMSHIIYEDYSSFEDDLIYSGPLIYIPSLTRYNFVMTKFLILKCLHFCELLRMRNCISVNKEKSHKQAWSVGRFDNQSNMVL